MTKIDSYPEKQADKSREFTAFKNFPLPGVKEKVAELLSLIGRNDGLFSTYTKHDISHIDSMLQIAEWLIPQETKDKMTPVDWLLITLAIYLHDAGMVIGQEEFNSRNDNKNYQEFLRSIKDDLEGQDYLKRVEKLEDSLKEKFFYQEYIRSTHTTRIREWITGKPIINFGIIISPFAVTIRKMLEALPSRFIDDLGKVCESHHLPDLNSKSKYPLYQPYGNNKLESANIQYAAIILRSADLLHVTQDRTPSLMYKTLNISDPIGITEWNKQMGTFAVNCAKRELNLKDPDSQIIVISADFKEERPFFSLSEYVSYSDAQIRQSKIWIQESNVDPDGKNYLFPWHTVRGNLKVEGNEPIRMRFELDRGKLLDLLVGHTIYNEPTVVVRELLQNSIDAVRFQVYQEKNTMGNSPTEGKVDVEWNEDESILVVRDNGTGMDKLIIDNHLMKVGSSFYDTPDFHSQNKDFNPISRFGIGILTCFMVSDDVEIITFKNGIGYRIKMSSVHSDYLLKQISKGDPLISGLEPHGTLIRLKMRPSVDLSQKTILDILKSWVILPPCAVYYSDKKTKSKIIGYQNVKEALIELYSAKVKSQGKSCDIQYEFIQDKNGTYEIAFMTDQAYPEKAFSISDDYTLPSVCLEGIRVAEALPGMHRTIAALLNVRGNKYLRTTVSRSELEVDDEYNRIAELCKDFLINHIRNEVSRISQKPGNPLSQAATGFRWLKGELMRYSQRNENYLNQKLREIPSIVIEINKEDGRVDRKLISENALSSYIKFWTINSRLSNYLGILSKDLGKEIGLNDFLSKLAPEYHDSKILPLVIDDEYLTDIICNDYLPCDVIFSREKQQVLVNWSIDPIWKKFTEFIDLHEKIIVKYYLEFSQSRRIGADEIINQLKHLINIKVRGDIKNVNTVISKEFVFLEPESNGGKTRTLFYKAITEAINKNAWKQAAMLIDGCVVLYKAFYKSNNVDRYERYIQEYRMLWADKMKDLNPIFAEYSLPEPSNDLLEIVGDEKSIFSVYKYWLDWDRRVD